MKTAMEERDGYVLIRLRVQPKAARNAISLAADGRFRVTLTAPPVEGAANKALTAFLAKALHVPKGAVELVGGARSRDKTLSIRGLSAPEVRSRLSLP